MLAVAVPLDEVARAQGLALDEAAALLAQARVALLAARSVRVRPLLDDKVLTGWNGMMVRGLAFAGRVFAQAEWVGVAQRAADFLLGNVWKDGVLSRAFQGSARIDGFMEDYGGLAAGLVELYQATFEPRYLEAAEQLVDAAVDAFWDEAQQAYLTARRGDASLPSAPFALHDGAVPSGASLLVEAQVGLAALTGRARHLEQAHRYLMRMREEALRNPFGFGHLLQGADAVLEGAPSLLVVGDGAEARALLAEATRTHQPTLAIAWAPHPGAVPSILEAAFRDKPLAGGRATAYLCRSFSCEAPVTDVGELRRQLERAETTVTPSATSRSTP